MCVCVCNITDIIIVLLEICLKEISQNAGKKYVKDMYQNCGYMDIYVYVCIHIVYVYTYIYNIMYNYIIIIIHII